MGIVPPGIINAIGSAAGCALLMGLSHAELLEAMAIGGGLAGWCPVGAVYDDGPTIKPMLHGAWPASIGVLSAYYAEGGMTGPVGLLESPMGLFSTLASQFDPEQVSNPGVWHLANPRRKLHSACGYTHAGTDAVAALYRELGPQLADAREIRISVPLYTYRAVCKSKPPSTPTESRFHLQFAAALAAVGEDSVRPEHGRNLQAYLARPDVQTILPRITITVDERFTHYEQCAVTVTLADGAVISRDGGPPRGAPANPMTIEMVKDKFRLNAAGLIGPDAIEAYIALIQAIEDQPHCDPLFAPFEPAA